MKIRLNQTLPIAKKHGCFEGEVFEVVAEDELVAEAMWVLGRSGELCKVFFREYDVVEDADAQLG